MNVVFISPHFPEHFYNFCDRLKRMGVNVLGIGDCPYDNLSENCRNSLTEYYYVPSMENYDDLHRAVAFFIFKYGRIDFIDSQNEYWLEKEAQLRSDFNICSGFKAEDMEIVKYKSKMKAGYEKANVKTARYHMVGDFDGVKAFIDTVGYPVVIKPDNGVGASDTWKITCDDELNEFWSQKRNVQYICEEFVPGHIETFDGITDKDCNILFCTGQVLCVSPMDMMHGAGENISYTQNVQAATDLYEAGQRVVKAFNTRNRFFHFEFFRMDEDREGLGKKGDVLGLEVNMRAPGGYIPDKMNYAYDVDVYQIWAESLLFNENRSFPDYKFKYYVTHFGRTNGVEYMHTPAEVTQRFGGRVVLEKEPPKVLTGPMGSHIFLLRSETIEELYEQANFILIHSDGQGGWV